MRWTFTIFFAILLTATLAALLFYPYERHRPAPGPAARPATQPPQTVSPPHQFANEEKRGRNKVENKDENREESIKAQTAGAAPATPRLPPAADGVLTLDWEDMIPPDWEPELFFEDYDIDLLDDDDELAMELLDRLEEVWASAPVVEELDGRLVRLPGFAVPLDAEPGQVAEFLLVPYFGACIHVPPPPANQIVYVKAREQGVLFDLELFDTVWVQGTMQAQRFSAELGEAGYTIVADQIETYEEDYVITLE